MGPRFHGMASRAGESRVKRRLRSGAPIPRNRAPGRDNRARRGRGTEGSNPSPSSGESGANRTSPASWCEARRRARVRRARDTRPITTSASIRTPRQPSVLHRSRFRLLAQKPSPAPREHCRPAACKSLTIRQRVVSPILPPLARRGPGSIRGDGFEPSVPRGCRRA
jgi:hypothetical protein